MTTTPNAKEASALAEGIVTEKLAACVQILPQMTSVYVWEGEIKRESEHLLLIKTMAAQWQALRDFIEANHSYDVPEIVAIESRHASVGYADWVDEVVGG